MKASFWDSFKEAAKHVVDVVAAPFGFEPFKVKEAVETAAEQMPSITEKTKQVEQAFSPDEKIKGGKSMLEDERKKGTSSGWYDRFWSWIYSLGK